MSLFEEKTDDEVPALKVEIIAEVTGPPAFALYVKQISRRRMEELQEMRDDSPRPGFRQDPATRARRKQKFLHAFCREVLEPRWDNATAGNLAALLARAKAKLGESALALIRDNDGQLPFSVDNAVALMRTAWEEDLDAELWAAARHRVGEAVKTAGEGGSGSGGSA